MALLGRRSQTYDWNLNLSEIARIWTGGCIIRAKLLEPNLRAFARIPSWTICCSLPDPHRSDQTVGRRAPPSSRPAPGRPGAGHIVGLDYFDT